MVRYTVITLFTWLAQIESQDKKLKPSNISYKKKIRSTVETGNIYASKFD